METVTIDEEQIPNTISSDHALLAPHSEKDEFGLPRENTTTDLHTDIRNAQRRTASGTFQSTVIEPKQVGNHTKGASKNTNLDQEYKIHNSVRHAGKGANTWYVVRWFG